MPDTSLQTAAARSVRMASRSNLRYATAPNKFVEAPSHVTYAYRELGPDSSTSPIENQNDMPVVMFLHLAAVLDNWDPFIIDAIAQKRHVIAFDQRGVGLSSGSVAASIEEMADHAHEFIQALGYQRVDLFGFSMGGFIVQDLVLKHPHLARKLVLTGTGPRGGKGIDKVTLVTCYDIARSLLNWCDAKEFLFFNRDSVGKKASRHFLARLQERKEDRDKPATVSMLFRQLSAIQKFARSPPSDLTNVLNPTLIANGDNDRMVPSPSSANLGERLKNSEVGIYPNSGHGGIFQHHEQFAPKVVAFLTS